MNCYLNTISNLFNTYGIKSITMDDIAKELGISKKTLYQHFKNKDDIIYKVMQYKIKSEQIEIDKLCCLHLNTIEQLRMISKYTLNKLRELNSLFCHGMNKYYPQIWEKFIGQRKKYILNIIKLNLEIGIKQGIYKRNLNTDFIVKYYTFLLNIKGFEMYNDGTNVDFDNEFDILLKYHIYGIAKNGEIECLEK